MILPVAVLAGGLATRLRPITEKTPKSLIIINNVPFVLHQLKLFHKNGIKHVHFCLGYLGELVEKVIENSQFPKKMKITFSYDGVNLLGTGGAIKKALPLLPDIFFVTYGDSYLDIDYKSIESFFSESSNDKYGLLSVYKNSNQFDISNVNFDNNKIVLYSKNKLNNKMEYIDYGLGILRKSHFSNYPENEQFDLSDIYENLSIKGYLKGYESFKRFYEIGSIKGIKELSNYLNTK